MPSPHNGSDETSPLLPKKVGNVTPSTTQVATREPTAEIAPGAPARHDRDTEVEAGEESSLLGRRASADGRAKQFEGMPELMQHMKYMFPALSMGVFLSAADQTIIVSSYGKIGSELDALNKTSWIATAYFLTLTSFQPLYGKLSDIFTRKSCLMFAYFIFGLGCLFCGLANDINQLIAARAFAGIGGAGMTSVTSILLSDVIPLKNRGQWQGYINIVYALGASTGAPLGGIFADGPGWRWSFLVQVPFCAVAFLAITLALKLPKKEHSNWKQKLRRIDFAGALVLVVAVSTLLVGMDRGSNVSWKDRAALIPLSLSVPLFGAFVFIEMKVAKEPFAPGRIIMERSLLAAFCCNFFAMGGYLSTLFYLPLYYEAVLGSTATQAGMYLIPNIVAGVSGSLIGGYYMRKTEKYYWITVICYADLVLGLIIIVIFSGAVAGASSLPGMLVGGFICGFGNGVGVTTTLIAIISNAAREDQAIGTACSYLFRSLGSTVGVSLSSTVAQQVLRSSLRSNLGTGKQIDHIVENVRRSLEFLKTLPPDLKHTVRQSYAVSVRAAFGLQVLIVAGAAIAAFFIREKPLSK